MKEVAIYRKTHLKVGDILPNIYHCGKKPKNGQKVHVKNFLTGKEYYGKVIYVDNSHYAVLIQRKLGR